MHPIIEVAGRFHPVLLHTPIGVLPALVIIELLSSTPSRAEALRLPRLLVWWVLALSAITSAVTGFILSREGGYNEDLVTKHLYLGITFAALCTAAALVAGRAKVVARLALLAVIGLVMLPTGHLGASLTHGEEFLTAPLKKLDRKPAPQGTNTDPKPEDRSWYATEIAPILENSCASCHGDSKTKGGLRLDTYDFIMEGGNDGKVVIPGDPDNSKLLVRVLLPMGNDERMPPDGKPGLTKPQIETLREWIKAGASKTAEKPGGSTTAPTEKPKAAAQPSNQNTPIAPTGGSAVAALKAAGASVERRVEGETAVIIALPMGMKEEQGRALLTPIAATIADLSWPGATLGAESLKLIRSMASLERLDLRSCTLTPADLTPIAGHQAIKTLNLAGSKLDAAGAVATIESLPKLQAVFLWDAGIPEPSLAALRKSRPNLTIDIGQSMGEKPVEQEPEPKMSNDLPPVK